MEESASAIVQPMGKQPMELGNDPVAGDASVIDAKQPVSDSQSGRNDQSSSSTDDVRRISNWHVGRVHGKRNGERWLS